VKGRIKAPAKDTLPLPAKGKVARYIFTSAQNSTRLHNQVWLNLNALARHYDAQIYVSQFRYETSFHGKTAKPGRGHGVGTVPDGEWYDKRIVPHICNKSVRVAPGLVFSGEVQILPTAKRPISGFESYTGRDSCILPHAKFAMQSVASGKNEATKFIYTTGTVTQRNYVQKKAGLQAQFHHGYGGLLVEVDDTGAWWVRQLNADSSGTIYDLDLCARNGKVTGGHRLEAVTWGDIHSRRLDPAVKRVAMEILDTLKPRHQFLHDLLDFRARNHHEIRNGHAMFERWCEGGANWSVSQEVAEAAGVARDYARKGTKTVVVNSNHDQALKRWLNEADYRLDPANALFFLSCQEQLYRRIQAGDREFDIFRWAMEGMGAVGVRYLAEDESYIICSDANGGIECGNHGHRGPNGMRGNPLSFARMGRKQNIGHLHTTGLWDGVAVAGTSSLLDMGYNKGPSSWSHSHIFTYRNGKRAIITQWRGKYRA
jgi:hypothetical protein